MRTPTEPIPLKETPGLRARWESFAPGEPFPATAHEIGVAKRARLRLWDPDLLEALYTGDSPKRTALPTRSQLAELRHELGVAELRERLKERRSAAQKRRKKPREPVNMDEVLINGAEICRLSIEKIIRDNNGLNPWSGEGFNKRLQKAIEKIDEEIAQKLKKEAAIAAALNTKTKRPNIRSAKVVSLKAIPRGVLA